MLAVSRGKDRQNTIFKRKEAKLKECKDRLASLQLGHMKANQPGQQVFPTLEDVLRRLRAQLRWLKPTVDRVIKSLEDLSRLSDHKCDGYEKAARAFLAASDPQRGAEAFTKAAESCLQALDAVNQGPLIRNFGGIKGGCVNCI